MVKKERTVLFKSRLPALIGEKQTKENRVIRVQEIADATGLQRATIYKWLTDKERFKVVDSDSSYKLCRYLACELSDLVEYVANEPDAELGG